MTRNRFPDIAQRNWTMKYVEVPLVIRLFAVSPAARVLDLGCGRGFGLSALAAHGFSRPIGLDLDATALTNTHAAMNPGTQGRSGWFGYQSVTVCCGDACSLPFVDESFDVVFDFGTSYHVHDPARSLAEVERVLCKGGRYIHETRANQLISHPVRSWGRVLPWHAAPRLVPVRHACLWASRVKQ